MSARKSVMIIAGEISGDMHAAGLINAVKKQNPDIAFFGIGGDMMKAAGVEILYHVRDMAVMGFAEVLRKFSFFRRVFHEMVAVAKERRPDAVILVDYPGFNLRFAKKAHELGIKTIYYICPQVWAWNRARIPEMARVVDQLITIFPFEAEHFKETGMPVSFVGHPLVDQARREWSEPEIELPWRGETHVALLPGSRIHVIESVLPAVWSAAALLEKQIPGVSFILASPSPAVADAVKEMIGKMPAGPKKWVIVEGETRQVLRQAKCAIVASGTATVEASLMLCPMVIVYKMAWLSYLLGKAFVKVPHIGMVNIMAGKRLCPELIQDMATAQGIAQALAPLLTDTPQRAQIVEGLRKVNDSLGTGGACDRAAGVVSGVLGRV